MALINFKVKTQAQIDLLPKVAGQRLLASDTGNEYFDLNGSTRIQLGGGGADRPTSIVMSISDFHNLDFSLIQNNMFIQIPWEPPTVIIGPPPLYLNLSMPSLLYITGGFLATLPNNTIFYIQTPNWAILSDVIAPEPIYAEDFDEESNNYRYREYSVFKDSNGIIFITVYEKGYVNQYVPL